MTDRILPTVVLLLAVVALAPDAAGHTDQAGHGHLSIALGDDTGTADVEPADQVSYRFEGSLPVRTTVDGRASIRLALPESAIVQRFTAPDVADATDATEEEDGVRYAVLSWDAEGQEFGEVMHNVTFAAARAVDPRAAFVVRWSGLGAFDDLPVRVEVPQDHIVAGDPQLRRGHGTGDRVVWSQPDLDGGTLDVSVRLAPTGSDPTRNAPPHPLGGWFVLLGIALVSGGAWAIGKRLEHRGDDRGQNP